MSENEAVSGNGVIMRIVIERPSDGILLEMVETDDTLQLCEWNGGNFSFRLIESDDERGVNRITSRIKDVLRENGIIE